MADEEKQTEMSEEEKQEAADKAQEAVEATQDVDVPEELVGVGLLILGLTEEKAAEESLKAMKKAKKNGSFYFENAAVIRQDKKGKIHISEEEDMSTGKGAGIGAVIGGLVGLLGGPGGTLLGAGIGAGIGGALAHHDAGFRKEGLEDVGSVLRPGSSALVVTTSKDFIDDIRKNVPEDQLAITSKNIGLEIADSLAEGKDMALGVLFTEEGVAVRKIRVDDESAEIFGFVITEDSISGGSAVVTEDGAVFEAAVATEEGVAYASGVVTDEGAVVDGVAVTEDEVVEGSAVILPDEDGVKVEKLADASDEADDDAKDKQA